VLTVLIDDHFNVSDLILLFCVFLISCNFHVYVCTFVVCCLHSTINNNNNNNNNDNDNDIDIYDDDDGNLHNIFG